MRSRNEVMTPNATRLTDRELQSLRNQGNEAERAVDMVFELEQNVARLETYVMQQDLRIGDLAGRVQRLKDANTEMFVSRCAAHQAATEAEQDAARWRMLMQQGKHWLGVFQCNPDGSPSDSLSYAEMTAMLDALIKREPAPSCKTPAGCRENGCLGWCDEHRPDGAKP